MKVKDLIERLHALDPNESVAYDLWQRGDVRMSADHIGITLSDDECDTILETIDRTKDASLGINWETLFCALEEYKR